MKSALVTRFAIALLAICSAACVTATDDFDTDEPLDQTELALEELDKGEGEGAGGAGPNDLPPTVETEDEHGITIYIIYIGNDDD